MINKEQDIKIINSIISDAIIKLESIPNLYEFKPIQKEDQDPDKLYYYFTNKNQIIKQIEILKSLDIYEVPVLEIDGKFLEFNEANEWVNNQ